MRKSVLFEGSEVGFLLENIESRALSPFSKKIEKTMPKGTSKVIVDAERHRRTPWTPGVESNAIESKKSVDIGGTRAEKREKNTRQNHQNTTKMVPKIDPKEVWGRFRKKDEIWMDF